MEDAKTYLRKTNKDGVSVYSHLTTVLATLLDQQPSSALDCFESVSLSCKKAHYTPGVVDTGVAPPEEPVDAAAPIEAWCDATSQLLAAVQKPSEDEPTGKVADMLTERTLFECAGAGMSGAETYRVYASLVALQKSKDLESVRFFGKVLGTKADYYVAEGKYNTPPEPEEGEEPPPPPPGAPVEESGTGCNAFTYFVTTDPSGSWTALPDVTPQQITYSKRIRKYCTGELNATLRVYPPFPGLEKEYLRALIARIGSATTLCPAGQFSMEEEATEPTPVEVGEEGRTLPMADKLGMPAGWVTRYMGILDIGRCTNPPSEEEEAEEGEAPKGPPPQPEIPYLSPIDGSMWSCTTYMDGGPPVAVVRSLQWPGALCAYQLNPLGATGAEVNASLYVGYGLPMLMGPFVMEAPPPFESEPEEVVEQADMPLAEENKLFLEKEKARIAEEAAALPDEEA